MKFFTRTTFLILVLFASHTLASKLLDFGRLLEKAEKYKSSDVTTFNSILITLSENEDNLTEEQYWYYIYLKGYAIAFSGDPTGALGLYYEALNGSSLVELKVLILRSILNIYAMQRQFEKGYSTASELHLLLSKTSENVKGKARVGLAIFYNKAGEHQLAINEINRVDLTLFDKRTQCVGKSMLVEALFNTNNKEFETTVDETLDICSSAEENVPFGINLLFKAKNEIIENRSSNAHTMLIENLQIIEASHYPYLQADFYATLAATLLRENELFTSRQYSEKVLDIAKNMAAIEPKILALKTLSEIYEQEGDYVTALIYFKQFAEAEKAFLDETKAKQLAIQQAKIESIEKNNKIALLDKENAILKAEALTEREEKLNTQLIAVILALLTIGTFVWARKNRRMHAMLRHKAQVDQLTNIANRSHFSAESERVIAQQSVLASPVSFIIFDLDFFKHVNDNHGHLTGDWVLEHTVKAVKPLLRNSDLFGRMGGEEFAILLSGCDAQQAITIAEKCRQAIENLDCSPSGALSLKVTASFGVSDSIQCGYSFDSLYGCADDALYKSKHAGRNDVYVYEPSFTSTPSSSSTSPTASPA